MTALQISLSDYTGAWQLYVGLMFVLVVMYAPWGLGGLLLMHQPLLAAGTFRRVLPSYALAAAPVLAVAAATVLIVETAHHLLVKASEGPTVQLLGLRYQADSPLAWAAIIALLAAGALGLRKLAPRVSEAFHAAAQQARTGAGR